MTKDAGTFILTAAPAKNRVPSFSTFARFVQLTRKASRHAITSSLNRHCGIMKLPVTRRVLILGLLVLANLLLTVWLILPARSKVAAFGSELPEINVVSDTGKAISLKSLIGRPVVLQFVNTQTAPQLESIRRLIDSFQTDEVRFVLLVQNSQELRQLLPDLPDNVVVVQNDYLALKSAFSVPECCERRFLFDSSGKLKYRDYYYEADLTPRLNLLVKKTLPPQSDAAINILNSINSGAFYRIREQSRSSSDWAVVVIFNSISSTCPSGELVRLLKRYPHYNKQFTVFLPPDFSDTDKDNFKANYKINFGVERLDEDLAAKWKELTHQYGEPKVNGTVVFMQNGQLSVNTGTAEIEKALSDKLGHK